MTRRAAPSPHWDPETIARVWWAMVTEPGDEIAGVLIATLGAEAAAAAMEATLSGRLVASRSGQLEPEDIYRLRRRLTPLPHPQALQVTLDSATRSDYSVLIPGSPGWPSSLDALGPAAPPVLLCCGDTGLLGADFSRVALVGTRRASPAGLQAAASVTRVLSHGGWVSVSGGARGIDTAVHRASLRAQQPTIVVSATCLENPYPRENRSLFQEIARSGLVVSETPLGKPVGAKTFLARNRLIAGLADATVVVEAPVRSGALNTASHAKAIGRDLYALTYARETPSNAGAGRLLEEWDAYPVQMGRGIVGEALSL